MIPRDLALELQPIAKEAHRVHESALYSAQGQFEQAKLWRGLNMLLGVPAAVLAAVSGGTALSHQDKGIVPGVLALLSAAFGATLTTINASRRMTQAQASANAYLALQTAARQFLSVDLLKLNYEEARAELKRLTTQRDELNNTADPPSAYAYWRAGRNVNKGRQSYDVDARQEV